MEEKNTGWRKPRKVNADWQYKFELYDRIQADRLALPAALRTPEYKRLRFKDKRRVSFNAWALLAGPFYYLVMRMWHKASLLAGAGLVLALILLCLESAADLDLHWTLFWVPVAAICSYFASHDYYRLLIGGEIMWRCIPEYFSTPQGALVGLGVPLLLFIGALIYLP